MFMYYSQVIRNNLLDLIGTIKSFGNNPITLSVANKNQYASYTFYFIPDTLVPIGGTLQITFPSQYAFGLGIPINPVCSVPCYISGFTVVLTFPAKVLAGVSKL